MGVRWEEPKKPVWHQRLERLRERPTKWDRVYRTDDVAKARKYAWRLNHQREDFNLPDGRWEFKGAEGDDDGVPGVFARFMGDD